MLKILVDGKNLSYFSNVKFSNNFDAIADGLIFNVPNTKENRKIFKPFKFTKIKCFLNGDLLLNGEVFKISVVDSFTLQVLAYNFAQHLVTCNLDVDAYPRTFQNSSLSLICKKILKTLDIKYFVTESATNDFNRIFKDKTHIEYNQTLADFLLERARQRNLIIKPNPMNGGIIFDKITKNIDVSLNLSSKKVYNELSVNFDGEFLFKNLTGIRGKTHKADEAVAKIKNDFVNKNRHFVKSQTSGEIETLTEFIKNEDKSQKRNLFRITINYNSILDTKGGLIKAGKGIILSNETFYINKETKFLIISCQYNFNDNSVKIEAQPQEIFRGEEMKKFWE